MAPEAFVQTLQDSSEALRMRAVWKSLFLIAVAETGDKSQLVALAFATQFSAIIVLAGVTAATLLVHLASVALGSALDTIIPET